MTQNRNKKEIKKIRKRRRENKMSEERKCNGWTNYETWCVDLWLGNEESEYNYWCDQAYNVKKEFDEDTQEYTLADMLKDNLEERAEEAITAASVFSDLLRAAISEVNFGEIARHLLDTVEVDEDEEEDKKEGNEE
jgi:hypothetical protein